MIDIVDLAYAAGIIDGEGCLYIYEKKKGRYSKSPEFQMGVCVSMTDIEVVKWLKEKWGGNLSARKQKEKQKLQLQWRAASKIAFNFLNQIYPYLKVKKRQAHICITFQKELVENQKRRKGFIGCFLSKELIEKRQILASLVKRFNQHGCIWSGILEGLPPHVVKKYQGEI